MRFRASLNSWDWMSWRISLISLSFFCSSSRKAWRSAACSRLSRIWFAASFTCSATDCWRSAVFFISSARSKEGDCWPCAWGWRSSFSSDFCTSRVCSAARSSARETLSWRCAIEA